jgi:hypothetical protein
MEEIISGWCSEQVVKIKNLLPNVLKAVLNKKADILEKAYRL